MSVKRYDNPLRYFVDSGSRRNVQHLVELDALNGNGQCTCEDFKYNRTPILQRPGATPSDATRCKHILEARNDLCDKLIARLSKMQDEPKSENRTTTSEESRSSSKIQKQTSRKVSRKP